jgi:RiboL-PSP-HEPN
VPGIDITNIRIVISIPGIFSGSLFRFRSLNRFAYLIFCMQFLKWKARLVDFLTMPSRALQQWSNDRMPRLGEIDAHCHRIFSGAPPLPLLAEESLRGYVALLSAHFQGFCRDLYAESAQVVASKVRSSLRLLVQTQFTTKLKLDHGNPNMQNIAEDFDRFGFNLLSIARLHVDFATRRNHLSQLNKWRNAVAHHGPAPHGVPPLTLVLVREWRNSCAGLATQLTDILYSQLRRILRRNPW